MAVNIDGDSLRAARRDPDSLGTRRKMEALNCMNARDLLDMVWPIALSLSLPGFIVSVVSMWRFPKNINDVRKSNPRSRADSRDDKEELILSQRDAYQTGYTLMKWIAFIALTGFVALYVLVRWFDYRF
jgi:hypothetical protein